MVPTNYTTVDAAANALVKASRLLITLFGV